METQSEFQAGLPDPCILLGGQPRSGTSLLTSILRASPGHFQAFELHIRKPSFITGLDGRYTRNIMCELGLPPEEYDSIVKGTSAIRMNLGAWCGPKEDISAEELTGKESEQHEGEFLDRAALTSTLMRLAAKLNDASTWGFKILGDVVLADLYRRAWPRSRFILMVRDPRDQAASLLMLNQQRAARRQANFYDDYQQAALGWRRTIERGRAALAACAAEWSEIKYEDLVQTTNSTLNTLSEFLNIDLHAGLSFHEKPFIDAHLKRFTHHDNLRRPVNSSSVGRWKKEIGHGDAAVFKDVAGDLMLSLGYE